MRPSGLYVSTAENIGDEQNYRVPDLAVHRPGPELLWNPTAAMAVEVVSPHDESWLKFDHYAAHGVDEVLIADPADRSLHLFVLVDAEYQPADSEPVARGHARRAARGHRVAGSVLTSTPLTSHGRSHRKVPPWQ